LLYSFKHIIPVVFSCFRWWWFGKRCDWWWAKPTRIFQQILGVAGLHSSDMKNFM